MLEVSFRNWRLVQTGKVHGDTLSDFNSEDIDRTDVINFSPQELCTSGIICLNMCHVVMSLNINTFKNRYDQHMTLRRGSIL